MPLRSYKPTSPGRRGMTRSTFEEITDDRAVQATARADEARLRPEQPGRLTVRHRGGGEKTHYRRIDFKRDKHGVPARIVMVEYDPNRSARIGLLHYRDGEKRYMPLPHGLRVGDVVLSGPGAEARTGNACRSRTSRSARPSTTWSSSRARAARSFAPRAPRRSSWPRQGEYAQVRLPAAEASQDQHPVHGHRRPGGQPGTTRTRRQGRPRPPHGPATGGPGRRDEPARPSPWRRRGSPDRHPPRTTEGLSCYGLPQRRARTDAFDSPLVAPEVAGKARDMSRSIKMVPSIEPRLLGRIEQMNKKNEKKVVKTWSRASVSSRRSSATMSRVYNGRKHVPVDATENMVGHLTRRVRRPAPTAGTARAPTGPPRRSEPSMKVSGTARLARSGGSTRTWLRRGDPRLLRGGGDGPAPVHAPARREARGRGAEERGPASCPEQHEHGRGRAARPRRSGRPGPDHQALASARPGLVLIHKGVTTSRSTCFGDRRAEHHGTQGPPVRVPTRGDTHVECGSGTTTRSTRPPDGGHRDPAAC